MWIELTHSQKEYIKKRYKLYKIHEIYNQHDDNENICSCGKINSYPNIKTLTKLFNQEKDKKEFLEYLLKINDTYKKELCAAYLKTTGDFQTFKEKINKEKLTIYDEVPIKFINELYESKLLGTYVTYLCEENWNNFNYKKDYLKRFKIKTNNLNKFLNDPLDLIKKIKLSEKELYEIEIKKFDIELIEKIYIILKNNKANIKIITTDKIFKEIIKHKFLALATKINYELAIQTFIQIHNCFPLNIKNYKFDLDYQESKKINLKETSKISPDKICIYHNDKIYKI